MVSFYENSMKKKPLTLMSFLRILSIVVGLVMVWRGIWYVLDAIDLVFFAGNHLWTGIFGIIIGLMLLYFPDKDLKEIEKL